MVVVAFVCVCVCVFGCVITKFVSISCFCAAQIRFIIMMIIIMICTYFCIRLNLLFVRREMFVCKAIYTANELAEFRSTRIFTLKISYKIFAFILI